MEATSQTHARLKALIESSHLEIWREHNRALLRRLESKHSSATFIEDALSTEMILNIGPQHPATHGVLRVVARLDGEIIRSCVIDIGYLHRGIEKVAEYKTFQEFMPYTDRMDYLSPYSNNVALCLAVEKLAQIEVPERGQYIRTIACELARILAHLLWLGSMVMDSGAVSMFLWTFREREKIYDLFDLIAGARLTVSHARIGGVASDLTPEAIEAIRSFIRSFPRELRDWEKLLNKNRIWLERNEGIGVVSAERALELGLTGPNLRASGVPYDVRTFEPYLVYDRVEFDVPVRTEGDNLARYYVRMEEMRQSVRIIEQCLRQLPPGPIRNENAKLSYPHKAEVYYSMEGLIHDFMYTDWGVCPPKGAEAYAAIEAPKGELGFYIQSDGTGFPWRLKIRSPSFCNIQALESMLEGAMVSDVVVLIGGVDPVMGEADK